MLTERSPEAAAHPTPRGRGAITRDGDHWADHHPLADEHAVLLAEVRVRERAVRAALGTGRWPRRELDALVAYLRYEVLDQADHEESLLFPRASAGDAPSPVRALAEDHGQLRNLTERLAAAATTDGRDDEPAALAELLDDLEESLDRHMRTEQAVLAAATTDGVESLRHPFRCHLWFPLTEGAELDLDALPREFAHRAALERFARMRPGERLLVRSSSEVDGLWNLLTGSRPGEFGWTYLEEGPDRWRVEVERRVRE
jgi:uncharacterized protein (DUF2249 family)/hemerythrin-like domain-containing protein